MTLKIPFKFLMYLAITLSIKTLSAQNLLDTSTWTIGTGSANGFSIIGDASENVREINNNHIGEDVIIWKAVPENINNLQCGGFTSAYKAINNNNTYRVSVWMKKTNSHSGSSFLATRSVNGGSHQIMTLAGAVISSPYFFNGDLPSLDRWYLIVGFVHNSNYSSTLNQGRIYDGVTGEEVQTLTDFKFTTSAVNMFHRAFLYNDPNVNDRQFLYDPRIDIVNSQMPSVNDLLRINEHSRVFFLYDTAGNQKQRWYCPDAQYGIACIPSASSREALEISKEKPIEEDITETNDTNDHFKDVIIHPNPTQDLATIKIKSDLLSKVEFIKIYNTNSSLIQELKFKDSKENIEVNLSDKPSGLYFVHIHFDDGSDSITKKIIKE